MEEPDVDWSKWIIFFLDERVVPLTDPNSNYKLAYDGFLCKVYIYIYFNFLTFPCLICFLILKKKNQLYQTKLQDYQQWICEEGEVIAPKSFKFL